MQNSLSYKKFRAQKKEKLKRKIKEKKNLKKKKKRKEKLKKDSIEPSTLQTVCWKYSQ